MPDRVPSFVPRLKLARVHRSATTYHLVPERRSFGWALCTVNDETGELTITSDWGNWSHRWPTDPRSLGYPTLTHFLAARESSGKHWDEYLARKLTLGDASKRWRFDEDKTVAAFRRLICERRLERRISFDVARALWDGIGKICTDNPPLFCERLMQLDGFEILTEEPWEHLEYEPTTEYTVLLHGILPALVEACAAEVRRRAELEASWAAASDG